MKNTFGSSLSLTVFGESHGPSVGAVLDGLAPGMEVKNEYIVRVLEKRRPYGKISTSRHEKDVFSILSGVYNGRTTGTPLCIVIPNEDVKSGDYADISTLLRPGHADYTSLCKYHGFADPRGGGHFSGRITAAICAACSIIEYALEKKGVLIGTHVKRCAGIDDRGFEDAVSDIATLEERRFPVLDVSAAEKMIAEIERAADECDSVGGITETVIYGLPAGIGEPFFDSVESVVSHLMFSIGGVKGVEFGAGFACADMRGTRCNDQFYIENGMIRTKTNNNGGINGGVANGMPVVFRCAVKPTPSIGTEQQTVDHATHENAKISVGGRHDPCIVHRACAVVNALTAFAAADLLAVRYGTDWLAAEGGI